MDQINNLPPIPRKSIEDLKRDKLERQKPPSLSKERTDELKRFVREGAFKWSTKLSLMSEGEIVCKLIYGPLKRTVEVTKKDFEQLLETPLVAKGVMLNLATRLREADDRILG